MDVNMKKFLVTLCLALSIICTLPVQAMPPSPMWYNSMFVNGIRTDVLPHTWFCYATVGGATGALDNIPISLIDDDDIAIAVVAGTTYIYQFDSTDTSAESDPDVIRPDDYAAAGTWLLTTSGISSGVGDVTAVGNCATGACFDGTSDGGTQILFYDANGATTLVGGNTGAAITLTLPAAATGTLYASGNTDVAVADGGTNSGTALNNDRVMVSSGGAIVESATVTATELALLNGETDLATQAELNTVAGLVDSDDEIIAIINASPGTQIGVAAGGTGAGTFTDGGILLGATTGAFEVTAAGGVGELLVGVAASNPKWLATSTAGYQLTNNAAADPSWNINRDFCVTDFTCDEAQGTLSAANMIACEGVTNSGGADAETDILLVAISYPMKIVFKVEEANIMEICPPSGEAFDLNGTDLAADDCVDSPAVVFSKMAATRMQNAAGAWI